jgi:insulysin
MQLFNPSSLEREREAVNSEYNMGAMQDQRRVWFVEQDIMRPSNHPYSYFACGNLSTLSSLDQTHVRQWFNAEYDPRGMHLVVFGQEKLSELESRVNERFGEIQLSPNWTSAILAESWGKIVPDSLPGSFVFVEPIQDILTLTMMFEIPAEFGEGGNRIAQIGAAVLRRPGKGSILSMLKEEGLAVQLFAVGSNIAADAAFLYIQADLTILGLAKYQRVVEILFHGIGTLGRLSFEEYVVQQHNDMEILDYKWQSRRTDFRYYAEAVYNLRTEDLKGYPRQSLFWDYLPSDISNLFLEYLTPAKSIVLVNAKQSDVFNRTFNLAEPIVGARYSLQKFSPTELAQFETVFQRDSADIHFPARSEYIPNPNAQVISPLDPGLIYFPRWEPKPFELLRNDSTTIYLSPDTEFGVPRIELRQNFFSPALGVGGNPRRQLLLKLWCGQIEETLQDVRDAASKGGYTYLVLQLL